MEHYFIESVDIREHPIKMAKRKVQVDYINALTYIIEKIINEEECHQKNAKKYVYERLCLYQKQLFPEVFGNSINKDGIQCLTTFAKPWRRRYRFMIVCDAALILFDEELAKRAIKVIKESLSNRQQEDVDWLVMLLNNNQAIEKKFSSASPLIEQFRTNKAFFSKEEQRIMVTANMSAGKSTLINALIGKPLTRTSQEVCTGNVCYLFNKACEDGNIHLETQSLNLSANTEDLNGYDWNEHISIASYFVGIEKNVPRLCIIDTPGVDAALYQTHSGCAHNALLNDKYDTLLYIISPTRLGTDAEEKHLRWVKKHLQKKKIIFVLNKLDDYNHFSDSIEESIQNLKEDLLKIGFEDPIICPISAYLSYLLKLKMTGQVLSEDEEDEYVLYSRKFKKSSYDLSGYYDGIKCLDSDSEEVAFSKRIGLYGFEKTIYGG